MRTGRSWTPASSTERASRQYRQLPCRARKPRISPTIAFACPRGSRDAIAMGDRAVAGHRLVLRLPGLLLFPERSGAGRDSPRRWYRVNPALAAGAPGRMPALVHCHGCDRPRRPRTRGMTEAGPTCSSTPCPPRRQKQKQRWVLDEGPVAPPFTNHQPRRPTSGLRPGYSSYSAGKQSGSHGFVAAEATNQKRSTSPDTCESRPS